MDDMKRKRKTKTNNSSSSSSSSNRTCSSSFPFDLVVISFPDTNAAEAAAKELAQKRQQQQDDPTNHCCLPNVPIQTTTDPYNMRIGSGGATLDVLRTFYHPPSEPDHEGERKERGRGEPPSILLVLAGGESSRCPTQMVLGKAWTSLPVLSQPTTTAPSSTTTTATLTTPLELCLNLFSSSSLFYPGFVLPKGSVVVVAGDTLIRLHNSNLQNSSNHDLLQQQQQMLQLLNAQLLNADVIGVALPAPCQTAQNHGVFVLHQHDQQQRQQSSCVVDIDNHRNRDEEDFTTMRLVPCAQVWQKPSLQQLQQLQYEHTTWIDSGVVLFLPHVVRALYHLSTTTYFADATSESSAGSFPTTILPKLDLYTHILQALKLSSTPLEDNDDNNNDGDVSMSTCPSKKNKDTYVQSLFPTPEDKSLAAAVWDALSTFSLHIWCLPGDFLHLGTSRELLDFYQSAPLNTDANHADREDKDNSLDPTTCNATERVRRRVGQSLPLVRRLQTVTQGVDLHFSVVAYHVVLIADQSTSAAVEQITKTTRRAPSQVGPRSVLEHCHIVIADDDDNSNDDPILQIGSDCLVSGMRRPVNAKYSLIIPDGMLVQMVELGSARERSSNNNNKSGGSGRCFVEEDSPSSMKTCVLIVLGVDDAIKSRETLFGRPFQNFLDWAKLDEKDLWSLDDGDILQPQPRTLWTAKLHAALDVEHSTSSIFDWLSDYLATPSSSTKLKAPSSDILRSLTAWKTSRRLSLLEIRDSSNAAAAEFGFRRQLVQMIQTEKDCFFQRVSHILLQRRLEPLDWRWIVQEYAATGDVAGVSAMLCALDKVFNQALARGKDERSEARYDVGCRTCRVASAFFRELYEIGIERGSTSRENNGLALEEERVVECAFTTPEDDPALGGILGFTTSISLALDNAEKLLSQYQLFISKLHASIRGSPGRAFLEASLVMESVAQAMTHQCVFGASPQESLIAKCQPSEGARVSVMDHWVIATAPARIDLAGGWTDTPPICFEYGSCVTGVAVLVDDVKAISCRCRVVSSSKGILLRSESRDGRTGELRAPPMEAIITRRSDLEDFSNPESDCALMKCALVLLGLVRPMPITATPAGEEESEFQSLLNSFCRKEEADDVGMEIVATSLLPHGSGLGTSSILGGCVIACIERCIGYDFKVGCPGDEDDHHLHQLIDSVLKLEQLLTTGGGFQDQVNGLFGGAKTVTCERSVYPLKLCIKRLDINDTMKRKLNDHLMLAFTGKTRLAKNLLQNVLRRWSTLTPEIQENVEALTVGAKRSREALICGDLDLLGECLSSYWSQKKVMAGADSGVEPSSVKCVLDELTDRRAICGASLCGAGGGGFMVLLTSHGFTKDEIKSIVSEITAVPSFTWHLCAISDEGLRVQILDTDSSPAHADFFNLAWHHVL